MWLRMRTGIEKSREPAIQSFGLSPGATAPNVPQPPDVSQLSPAGAARTLGNWNYDHQNRQHAIEHYEQALARGADPPDVRTDLGNCFRFLGQPQKALEQYEIAQRQNPRHENSLFNQISLCDELLHDHNRAQAIARDFIARFSQSTQAEMARKLVLEPKAPGGGP